MFTKTLFHKIRPDEEKERIGPSKPQISIVQPPKPLVPPSGTAPAKPPPPPPPSTSSSAINPTPPVLTPAPMPTQNLPPTLSPMTGMPQSLLAPQGMMLVPPRPPVGPPPIGPPTMMGENHELMFPYGKCFYFFYFYYSLVFSLIFHLLFSNFSLLVLMFIRLSVHIVINFIFTPHINIPIPSLFDES